MIQCKTDMNNSEQKYTPYTDSLMFAAELLVRACKEATRKCHKEMGFGISHEEYIILETIFLNPGIIQFNVSKKLFMQRSYVCKMLARLEDLGFVRKENAIKGKRTIIVRLYLTEGGNTVYNAVRDNIISTMIAKHPKQRFLKNRETAEYLLFLVEDIRKDYNIKL